MNRSIAGVVAVVAALGFCIDRPARAGMSTDAMRSLPADVVVKDKKGKLVTLSGELYFESWPLATPADAKKPAAISKQHLVPTKINPARFQRTEDGKILWKGAQGEKVVEFPFEKIPVRLTDSKELSQAIEKGFTPDSSDVLDPDAKKKEPPPPPPVVLGLDAKVEIEEILVSQVQSIQFKVPKGTNMEIGGRYLAYSKQLKGSSGTIQPVASTFFGGAGAEKFSGGGFLKDGTIAAVMQVTDLSFAPKVEQIVIGKDPADATALPAESRSTIAIVHYSADLQSIVKITRLAWGSAILGKIHMGRDGCVYVSGGALDTFESVMAATKAHTIANPEAAERAKEASAAVARNSFVAKFSPDVKGLEWVAYFPSRAVDFGLSVNNGVLVQSATKFWDIDAAGKVTDGRVLKTPTRTRGKTGLVVSPYDGACYWGGDYNSGTGFEPYRNPYFSRVERDGRLRWTAWNWTGPVVGTYFRQVSDSSIQKVKFARNGDLMIIGWSDGGNTVLTNPPYDLEKGHGKYGAFSDISAAGAGSFANLLRMDPRTMEIKAATWWLCYLPYGEMNGRPNSGACRDMHELEDGRWAMVGGTAFATIETPDAWIKAFIVEYKENPETARPKAGSCFVVFDPDLRTILFSSLTPALTGQCLDSQGKKVVLMGGAYPKATAYGWTLEPILKNPLQKEFGGGATDGYVMVIDTDAKK